MDSMGNLQIGLSKLARCHSTGEMNSHEEITLFSILRVLRGNRQWGSSSPKNDEMGAYRWGDELPDPEEIIHFNRRQSIVQGCP